MVPEQILRKINDVCVIHLWGAINTLFYFVTATFLVSICKQFSFIDYI